MLPRGHINTGLGAILEFIYPTVCLICDSTIEKPGELICPDCWQKIDTFDYIFCGNCEQIISSGPNCPRCGVENSFPFAALGNFGDPLGEMIRQFKHHGFTKLGMSLTHLFIKKHKELIESTETDIIVPVPLHSIRLKLRGFNQAEIIADIIGKEFSIGVDNYSLRKIRNTRDQKMLDHDKRIENIKGAFKVFGNDLTGKKILLIDDVITTGATLNECRKVITETGGSVVLSAVLATAGFIC